MTSAPSTAFAADARLAEAEAAAARYEYRQGTVLAREALDLAVSFGDAALTAQARVLLARLGVALGDLESAARHGEQALEHVSRHGPPALVASLCNALSFVYDRAGLHTLAVDHGLQALETARACGDRAAECLALNRLGSTLRGPDGSARAIGMLEEAVRLARLRPEPDAAFWPLNNLASRWIDEADRLVILGGDAGPALAAAREHAREAETLAQASGRKSQQAMISANLAGIDRRRGEFDLARARFSTAIALAHEDGAEGHEATFRLALASLEAEAAPSAAACIALEQALDAFTGPDPHLPMRSRRVLARAWRALGDSERSYAHLERLLADTQADADRLADVQWRLMSRHAELVNERHAGDRARLELELQRARAEAEARVAQELAGHRDRLEQAVAARTAELQGALAAAEAASRAKTVFLSIVSHELRTPLNGVIGMVEVARRRCADERQAAQLDKSLAAAWQLSRVVDRLLEFVADSGANAGAEMATDLRAVIDASLSASRPQANAKGLVLESEVAPEVPARVHVDGARLQRVLEALLDNAVKFSTRGTVRVQARWQGGEPGAGRLTLAVVDEGPGMAPELVRRLFLPFEMGDASASRAHGGLGIGLALVFRWVQSLGGEIAVESDLHAGTAFRVTLPVRSPCNVL